MLYANLHLQCADGILVPGGFGDRGVQGKILAAKYARENNIPYLGICLGMQIAIIEFARSVLNLQDANSTEFDPDTTNPCVIFMPEVDRDAILFSINFFFMADLNTELFYTMGCQFFRVQRPIWGEQCDLGQGGLIFRLMIASLQSCEDQLSLNVPYFQNVNT